MPASDPRSGRPIVNATWQKKRRRVRGRRRIFVALFVVLLISLYAFSSTSDSAAVTGLQTSGNAFLRTIGTPVTRATCDETLTLRDYGGFSSKTLTSTGSSSVLILFSETEEEATKGVFLCGSDTGKRRPCSEEQLLHQRFSVLAESYLSSPQVGSDTSSKYHDFFRTHNATFWVTQDDGSLAPLTIDVVYTYVNPTSPSYKAARRTRGFELVENKAKHFRDWDELRYSLRSLRQFALRSPALRQCGQKIREDARELEDMGFRVSLDDFTEQSTLAKDVPLLRHVYLVVAHEDQLPQWLNTSAFPALRVVTHDRMFSAREATTALPTFNSLAIESVMYRIPGLSRFFWYFNNDMIIGRTVSIFDLYRPLSPARQRLYFMEAQHTGGRSLTAHRTLSSQRHALLLEPIFHVQGRRSLNSFADTKAMTFTKDEDQTSNCTVISGAGCQAQEKARLVAMQCLLQDQLSLQDSAGKQRQLRTTPFMFAGFTDIPREDVLNNYASKFVLNRLEGVLPTYLYAHVPLLADRFIMRFALDGEGPDSFAKETTEVRKAFVREMNSFSPVHIYTPLALALRRARDRQLWHHYQRVLTGESFEKNQTPLVAHSHIQGPSIPNGYFNPSKPVQSHELCPLCGDSFCIQEQRADLFRYLSLWDWQASGAASKTAISVTPDGVANRMRMKGGGSLSLDPLPLASSEDNYIALHADVFHHLLDKTMRFLMVEDQLRLGFLVALVKRLYAAGTPTLFITVNDDLDPELTASELEQHKSLFVELLLAASSYAPAAPWEK